MDLPSPEEITAFQAQRSHMLAPGAKPLTRQQESFVMFYLKGFSAAAAARAAGYTGVAGSALLKDENIASAISFFQQTERENINVTRELLTRMLFEAHRKSATATEEIAAIRELGKMHGVYEQKDAAAVNVNVNIIRNIERLPDEELLKLAGMNSPYIESPPIEGSVVESDA